MSRIGLLGTAFFLTVAHGALTFAEVPPADIEAVFQRLDKNGDGKVSASEIPEDQARFFQRLLRRANKEANGELTQDEFVRASQPDERPNTRLGNPGPGGEQGPADPKHRFEMLDRNKDGKLTLDEVPEPLRDRIKPLFDRLGKQEVTLEEFTRFAGAANRPDPAEIFKRFDANSDGKLTKDEMPPEMRERLAPVFERLGKSELTQEELASVFARAGRGEAGRVSEGERPPGAREERKPDSVDATRSGEGRPGDAIPDGRGPILFRMLDTNRDGQISKEEYAKLADLFDQLDRNHDGQLDIQELIGPPPGAAGRRAMTEPRAGGDTGRREGSGRERPDAGQNGAREPGELFKRLDRDDDGKLSKDEVPELLKDKFGMLDTNGDGFVSQDEARAGARIIGEALRSRQAPRPRE